MARVFRDVDALKHNPEHNAEPGQRQRHLSKKTLKSIQGGEIVFDTKAHKWAGPAIARLQQQPAPCNVHKHRSSTHSSFVDEC
jgi:hypothetical protein